MFIETHVETIKQGDIEVAVPLVFIKSTNVQAYPCGRRRSNLTNDGSRIPFDPEARLNTEANNRKHSGLNGFTQTYLKNWDEANKLLTLSLAGYLFNITLPDTYLSVTDPAADNYGTSEDKFGKTIVTKIEDNTATKIYANILIEDAQLFSGFQDYFTGILRNQSNTYGTLPEDSLDLLVQGLEQDDYNSYYFSGLSFSTKPLTIIAGDTAEDTTYHEKSYSFDRDENPQTRDVKQTFVSLCILEKVNVAAKDEDPRYEWKIHEPARLPKIEHGDTEDSIVVTGDATLKSNLYVEDNINVGTPTNPATDNNGGNIVAKNNITAEKDLVAKQNLQIDGAATVEGETTLESKLTVQGETELQKNLIVGDDTDLENTGTITAKTHVETPTLNASASITTPLASISSTLNVQSEDADNPAEANIDKATITEANITTATITEALVVNDTHTANGTIFATKNLGDDNNIEATKVNITTLTGDTAEINDITGTTKVSSAQFIQNGNPVPIIDVVETDGYWQLQLTRVSVKSKT